jgi:hypothetical protein
VYFDKRGLEDSPVYLLNELHAGHIIQGPAVVMDALSTILIEPDCTAEITNKGAIHVKIGNALSKKIEIGTELDTIQLSIFSHRFMSIAEQMGRILQRTSISTNIKERFEFFVLRLFPLIIPIEAKYCNQRLNKCFLGWTFLVQYLALMVALSVTLLSKIYFKQYSIISLLIHQN